MEQIGNQLTYQRGPHTLNESDFLLSFLWYPVMLYYATSRVKLTVVAGIFTLLSLGFWQCKSPGVDPDTPSATEFATVNSTTPGVFMAGTYQACYLSWSPVYDNITEGQDWRYTPDPASIRGDYRLIVEPIGTGADSVRIMLDGSGHGPSFKRQLVGKFRVEKGRDLGKLNNEYRTGYPLQDGYTVDKTPRIDYERLALTDKTVFTFDIFLTQFFDSKDALKLLLPNLTFKLESALRPALKPVPLFQGRFRRVSPALVIDPYK